MALLGRVAMLAATLSTLAGTGCDRGPGAANGDSGGDAGDAGDAVQVTDDAGRAISLESPPERIVSLVPSATEILVALGAAPRLVGRTEFDTIPPVDTLPSVGGGLRPSMERVVALDPDLVVRFAGPSDPATPERLTALGIPHLAVRPDGIDDVRRIVRLLGTVVAARERAESLVRTIDEELERVRGAVSPLPEKRVAFVLGGSPPWVAGPGTFIDELLEVAGGRNAFADLDELYGAVSPEVFVSLSIDVVLTVEGSVPDLPGDHPVRHVPGWIQTPGPDLGEAARAMARAIHPEAIR